MQIVTEVPADETGRAARYPWDEWADGELREAIAGADFATSPSAFASAARSWASSRGWLHEVAQRGSSVYFRIVPGDTRPDAVEAVREWLNSECAKEEGKFLPRTVVFEAYELWAARQEPAPLGRIGFYAALRALGVEESKRTGVMMFKGINPL